MNDSRRLVDKLWSYCDVLRDDGVGVLEYSEQLTYLLFLKMADERSRRPEGFGREVIVPAKYSWHRLIDATGVDLEVVDTPIIEVQVPMFCPCALVTVNVYVPGGRLGIRIRPSQRTLSS